MTASAFRDLALALPGTLESAHMNHPDFRVNGRIFASLGYPDEAWGMVKLPLERQRELVEQSPRAFRLAAGAWGRQGSTVVRLAEADPALVRTAMKAAHALAVSVVQRSRRRSRSADVRRPIRTKTKSNPPPP